MIDAPLPSNEPDRIRRLMRLGVLDASRDEVLDALVQRALLLFPGADSAVITFVTTDRVWYKACAGRTWQHASRNRSFCAHTILDDRIMVVEDAWRDERFSDHPMVAGDPGIRFYAGAPLMDRVGALGVAGLHPRLMTKIAIETLTVLAQTVGQRLTLQRAVRELTRRIPLSGGFARDSVQARELFAGANDRRGHLRPSGF